MRLSCYLLPASLAMAAPVYAQQQPVRGFPADAQPELLRREAILKAVPNADTLRSQMRILSEDPHEAGTDRSRHVAELVLQRFKSFGLDAQIERFEALMPRPIALSLEMTAPEKFTAQLQEAIFDQDKDARDANQLPTYNAYSPDGDVSGEVVYVNYGVPADYRVLDSLGVSVKGKIVLARYGASWRGIKPKVAAEHGAVGCLIYSDPRNDGYYVADVYPAGPMRPWSGVQRGSVMDMPRYPGDPLTPGWAGEAGSRKLALSEVTTIEPIPVIPISYENALPLLRNLAGKTVPDQWKGALPVTYHTGPGPATVHLAVKFDWQVRPLYNVIARIPGAVYPDQWVVYGNHHDAWVNGAADPISGLVALLETARSFARLRKSGWQPARTLIFAAWDGEEWGLLGSTEWAEKHQAELSSNAVAYLNSDTNDRGWISAAGSHSLQTFLTQVARDVYDPVRKRSVLDAYFDRRRERTAETRAAAAIDSTKQPGKTAPDTVFRADTAFAIGALGSGSDYTAFLDHLGVASMNVSYGGEQPDGIYHSVYDSYDFYTRFKDTTFVYGVTEAQTTATLLLRLADAAVLPFEFTNPARIYSDYAAEIEKAAARVNDVRALDLAGVHAALHKLADAAAAYERVMARVATTPSAQLRARTVQLRAVNRALYASERALIEAAGLPDRAWFRHLIYAPGYYTGYGVKTLPGIREAVEDKPDLARARTEAARVTAALDRYTAGIEEARALLENALR